jgi:predicted nucleic acid-binding protein
MSLDTPDTKWAPPQPIVLDVNVLVRGSLGLHHYYYEKYALGNALTISDDTRADAQVFVREGGHGIRVVVSDELIAEWERIRNYKQFRGQFDGPRGDGIDCIIRSPDAVHVRLREIPSVFRDPADDYLIATALAGAARYVVSSDKDVLAVPEYSGVQMVSPDQFLDICG